MLPFLFYFVHILLLFFLSQLEEEVNEFIHQKVISENFKREPTVSAATRFKPTPPALVDIIKTKALF